MPRAPLCSATLVLALAASAALAHPEAVAFVGATLLPISAPPIADGVLVVQDGRIAALGARGEVEIPPGAEIVDSADRVILPGLVDTHSHIAGPAGGDRSRALHPDVRVLDSVDVRSDGVWKALAGGITTVNVMPGSGHLMSGQTVYLKLRAAGPAIEDWLICDDGAPPVCGGLKMANGTNSMHDPSPPFPGTRGKSAALARELFVSAREYAEKLRRTASTSDGTPDRDLGLEVLAEVLAGRRIVHFHTHRHDDIATVIRLAREFGFRPVLHHVSEGAIAAAAIAEAELPCSVIVIDSPGGKHEAVNLRLDTAAALQRAGVEVALHTDDGITDSRFFLRSAALAVRAGLNRDKALEALTLAGARMLGLAGRVGSLEVGKDADLAVLSGDPLATATRVEATWVEGKRVFDRSTAEGKAYALGGYRVYRGDVAGHAELEGGTR